ncbi:hypothetical protein GY45DRAFT_1321798 [Cubamyces sp. BRFM 1775]|nr:hypothetical protein GY45DRAFT_1321798 [Cubamyces sp. BRFM 1775]
MSSGTPSATSSSATSSSTQTGTGSTGMQPNLNANSSLPFSFLVTFIAIFLFFLGCGLGSRRFTRQLRRNLALQITPADTPSSARTSEKPILWDTYAYELPFAVSLKGRADRAADRCAWERMSPLSATYVRTAVPAEGPRSSGHPVSGASQPPRWDATSVIPGRSFMRSLATTPSLARPPPLHASMQGPPRRPTRTLPEVRWRGHRLPQFLARPLLPPGMQPSSSPAATEELEPELNLPIRALEVAILISMPSPEKAKLRKVDEAPEVAPDGADKTEAEIEELEVSEEETMGDYVLGFARVPWDGEIDSGQGLEKKGSSS